MKKLSKKTKIKNVKKNAFEKLTPPQQRVAIAKDVLEQIRIKRFTPYSGKYISSINFKNGLYKSEMGSKDIKSNFAKIKNCSVCAMGACLMSATKFANKLNFEDVGVHRTDFKDEKVKDLFSSIFSPEQLLLIEIAFEGNDSGADRMGYDIFGADYPTCEITQKCDEFYLKYEDEKSRMVAIMKNLIKNKGEFKP